MKQQEVFKKIGIIINELNEQYEYLVSTEDELNHLELELFVANARFLADHSEVLQKLSLRNAAEPKAPPVKTEKYFEPVVHQTPPPVEPKQAEIKPKAEPEAPAKPLPVYQAKADENPVPHIDLRGDDTGTDYSYIRQEEPATIRHELILDEAADEEEEIIAPQPVEAKKTEPVQPSKEKPAKIIVEDAPEEPLTINQRISAQLNNTASRASEHVQAVTDLKQAITLNDKLLYIKDLFNGYNLAYNEAIDILNRYDSFDEAEKFLTSNYAVKNNWGSKQATADKFYDLLRRRYA
jgi:hypothetical protein